MRTILHSPVYPNEDLAISMAKAALGYEKFFSNQGTYQALVSVHGEKLLEALALGFELGTLARLKPMDVNIQNGLLEAKSALFDAIWAEYWLDGRKGEKALSTLNIALNVCVPDSTIEKLLIRVKETIETAIYSEDDNEEESLLFYLRRINETLYEFKKEGE